MKTRNVTLALRAAAALVAALLCSGLRAQETTCSKNCGGYCGGFGYFSFSAEAPNIGPLNTYMKEAGFEKFMTTMPSWGGGGMFACHNFLIGGQGAGYFTQKVNSDGSSGVLSGGYGQGQIGYMFHVTKRGILYPAIGFGGGGLNLSVGPHNSGGDFSQQLKSPSGTMSAQTGGWFLTGELAYNHFFAGAELNGFFIGARAGYRYAPGTWQFQCNGQNFTNSPTANLSGVYFTLLIGGGGLNK